MVFDNTGQRLSSVRKELLLLICTNGHSGHWQAGPGSRTSFTSLRAKKRTQTPTPWLSI